MTRTVPLTLAGSDPTGGAGLEADLKVFLAHGLSGSAVSTCLTDQDLIGVHEIRPIPAGFVRSRLDSVLRCLPVRGVKTGLLPGANLIRTLARVLGEHDLEHLVIDPVLAPSHGAPFLDRSGRRALIEQLFPLASVITPNLDEAADLLGMPVASIRRNPARATGLLRQTGAAAVLLKGGHGRGVRATDLLDDGRRLRELHLPRICGPAGQVHGTGCALSAALLARLLSGRTLIEAAREAKRYVHSAIRRSTSHGKGQRLLDFSSGR